MSSDSGVWKFPPGSARGQFPGAARRIELSRCNQRLLSSLNSCLLGSHPLFNLARCDLEIQRGACWSRNLVKEVVLAIPLEDQFRAGPRLSETVSGDDHFLIMPVRTLDLEKVDRKSTRLNSSHLVISYAVFCL